MNCSDVMTVVDQHRGPQLAPAERAAIDEHLAACADCAAAWDAHAELRALPVPPLPPRLLERALSAAHASQHAQPRRARAPIVVAGFVLAGAAAAAVTLMSVTRTPSDSATPATDKLAAAASETVSRAGDAPAPTEQPARATSVELVETALSLAPIVRRPPVYPPRALERGLEGHVQVRFDVSAAGVVENLSVEDSSDGVFEESALRAVAEWRYLPRIVAGQRAAAAGVQTVIRFALGGDAPPLDARARQAQQEAIREYGAFSDGLEVAVNRLAADDARGAELQLDELLAVYGADRLELWSFYGYLYTVQGNYDRAIEAYERSVTLQLATRAPSAGPWVPLANLYYARHQYDLALRTLLRQRRAAEGAAATARPFRDPEADALMARLDALGVTDAAVR